jgi:hypothetical protein
MTAGAASDIKDLCGFILPGFLLDKIAFAIRPLNERFLIVFFAVIIK